MERIDYFSIYLFLPDDNFPSAGKISTESFLTSREKAYIDNFIASQPFPDLLMEGEYASRNGGVGSKKFYYFRKLCLERNLFYQKIEGDVVEEYRKRATSLIMCDPEHIFRCLNLLRIISNASPRRN